MWVKFSRRKKLCFHHAGQKRLTGRLTCPSSENWFDSESLCITFLRTINLKRNTSVMRNVLRCLIPENQWMSRRDEVYWWSRIRWRSPHVSNYLTVRSTWISVGRTWWVEDKNMQPTIKEMYWFSSYLAGDYFIDHVVATVVNWRQVRCKNNRLQYCNFRIVNGVLVFCSFTSRIEKKSYSQRWSRTSKFSVCKL
jgi:hypothetical protein